MAGPEKKLDFFFLHGCPDVLFSLVWPGLVLNVVRDWIRTNENVTEVHGIFFTESANSVVMSEHVSVSVCVSVYANFCDLLNILLLSFKKLKVREDFGIRFKDFGRKI